MQEIIGSHEQHSLSLDKITPDIIQEILSEKKSSLDSKGRRPQVIGQDNDHLLYFQV